MEYNVEYFKGIVKEIKFPKVNLPKISLRNIEKPPRWLVIVIAILLEITLMFVILWLFDDRTIFDNDYKATKYSGDYMKWGWVHMGIAITLVLTAIGLFFAIIGEFAAWEEKNRTFYNFYR